MTPEQLTDFNISAMIIGGILAIIILLFAIAIQNQRKLEKMQKILEHSKKSKRKIAEI